MKTYQDQWMNGRLVSRGIRECADRYDIIKYLVAVLRAE